MHAIVLEEFGSPKNLVPRDDVSSPTVGPNQVLVRVRATSVNPVDTSIRQGALRDVRTPAILGSDVAGEIVEVGEGVDDLQPGDQVFYSPPLDGHGSYAELHAVKGSLVAPMPPSLSYEHAASLPLAGMTALQAMHIARLGLGDRVLVHGGAGGVGSLAIQVARAMGAEVFTTCGEYNRDLCERLGADVTIDYRSEDFVDVIEQRTDGQGVDVVLDTQGGDVLSRSIRACAAHARVVCLVNGEVEVTAAKAKNIAVLPMMMERTRDKLMTLHRLVELGRVCPVVEEVRPLDDVPQVHQDIERGQHRHGKLVLEVGG